MSASNAALDASGRREISARLFLRVAIGFLLAVALAIGIESYVSRQGDRTDSPSDDLTRPTTGPRTYAEALTAATAQIAAKQQLRSAFPADWLRDEAVAYAYLDRFRLRGDFADLSQASEIIVQGRSKVAAPAGPLLAQAEIAMAGHDMAGAESALRAFAGSAVMEPSDAAYAAALAGDMAFYRGDLARAVRRYADARGLGSGALLAREAMIDKARGRFDDAIAKLRRSLAERRRPTPFAVATFALQVGAIEFARGDVSAARRWFERANAAFPGYWLTEAHLAQADALDGHPQRAIAAMQRVAERSGSAEAMDALAMLMRTFGRPDDSRAWAARARAVWQRRLALAPEAAVGHAVEHELVFGTPQRALDLAQRNVANRPFGESRVLLASALIQNGRIAEALGHLKLAEVSGWRSAPLYALRAQALDFEGRETEADAARDAARALNPRIFDPQTALIWFSHG